MYNLILFDIDGVLLSEERYFDASALTVWELLFHEHYLGLPGPFTPSPDHDLIRQVRSRMFHDDEILSFMKSRGINSNWDMVYLTFSHQLILLLAEYSKVDKRFVENILTRQIGVDEILMIAQKVKDLGYQPDFSRFVADFSKGDAQKQELLLYLNTIAHEKIGVDTSIFSRNSRLWNVCQETFQEWYLGDQLIAKSIGREARTKGKRGFLKEEIPIVPPEEMREVFSRLKEMGCSLGIGTGRPTIETMVPLGELELLDFFERERIVTASDVLDAEKAHPEHAPLAKPQPFCYVKGIFTKNMPDDEVLKQSLPLRDGSNILIVGDSVADYMAARAIGAHFAATLTGLSGKKARETFEKLHADYILEDMRDIISVIS
ncbi:HAD hydrolase-like protein [Microaerobacter geothermalis]|uniref:HAD family hydrolase n=1 Tax=Microaerobacter geothermalis TaxID=674972 RepID=UPI001F306ADD|nr:HAD family hydrolase [Microaerobacter geothermalis]MCF6094041.1 HAD hydrolase-like protein [Microaerobacter geothermalis]